MKDIKQVKKSSSEMFVELINGDTYQAVSASQSSRGYKCDKAYVDIFVDKYILDCIIKPCLCISNLSEENKIEFFKLKE